MTSAAVVNTPDIFTTVSVLERTVTEKGHRLVDLVEASTVLLVFLRHSGCTFCREAVADIAAARQQIESGNTRIVLVHMGDRAGMKKLLAKHRLESVERICDEARVLYKVFGLRKGSFRQLFGIKVWFRGMAAAFFRGHGLAIPAADPMQMPGVFLLERGLIARAYRHRSAADRPCYTELCDSGERRA